MWVGWLLIKFIQLLFYTYVFILFISYNNGWIYYCLGALQIYTQGACVAVFMDDSSSGVLSSLPVSLNCTYNLRNSNRRMKTLVLYI